MLGLKNEFSLSYEHIGAANQVLPLHLSMKSVQQYDYPFCMLWVFCIHILNSLSGM